MRDDKEPLKLLYYTATSSILHSMQRESFLKKKTNTSSGAPKPVHIINFTPNNVLSLYFRATVKSTLGSSSHMALDDDETQDDLLLSSSAYLYRYI